MKKLKKILIGLLLLLLVGLSIIWLAVNSPYVVDKFARKFAPQYGFGYERIVGNPLKGIVVENLTYHKKKLARQIHIRINPYALLEKKITVSRLKLLDVNVTVLERMIRDFTAPSSTAKNERPTESAGGGLPLAVEAKNIRLTLRPFQRYGVNVKKEELSVDSIYYDGGIFNVGHLRQIAETSLGTVQMEGTYHKRFLDVKLLAVDDLDLAQLKKLLTTLGIMGKESNTSSTEMHSEANASSPAETASGDIFLPRKIHADKLWVTLKPYTFDRKVHITWAQVEGRKLLIDLEKGHLLKGEIFADLSTNLGNARWRATFDKGVATLQEGVVDSLDLEKILALVGQEDGRNTPPDSPARESSGTPGEKETAKKALDRFPFVPPSVIVKQLRVEFKPGRFDGVDYSEPIFSVKNLQADLHRNRLTAEKLTANLDTPLMHLNLDAAIDSGAIRIHHLDVRGIDLKALTRLGKRDRNASAPNAPKPAVRAKGASKPTQKGLTLPFVPSVIVLEEGRMAFLPFFLDPLRLKHATVSLGNISFDLTRMLARRGVIDVEMQSNLTQAELRGTIANNTLVLSPSKSNELRLEKALFERFGVPLRAAAFSPIRLHGKADEKEVDLTLSFSGHKILADRNASFNIDINRSLTTARFRFADGKLTIEHESRLSVPQAPKLRLHAELSDEGGKLRYTGRLEAAGTKLGNPKIEKMLGAPRLDFSGDLHTLKAKLDAGILGGTFVSPDFKKGQLKLGTKKPLKVADYFKLPKKLSRAAVDLKIDTPVDFTKPLPLQSKLVLRSNLANIDGTVRYDGNLSTELTARFPKNSLLASFDPKLRLGAISPLKLSLSQRGELWHMTLKSKRIAADLGYTQKNDTIDGTVKIAGSNIKISGQPRKTILATLKSPSVKKMVSGITDIYKVEVPKLDGDVALTLKIDKLSSATLELKSTQFIPDDTARIKSPIKDIDVLLSGDMKKKTLIVKSYHLETAGMKVFASKPSVIRLEKNRVILDAFWVNDSLKAQGTYDLKTSNGDVTAKAADFKVDHENAKLDARIDLNAKINGMKIDVKGKIVILGGNVMYNIEAKHYATDEDIVILQHHKKNEESFFRKNVQLNLYIETKKPLLFKQKDVYVELRPQLTILKGYGADLQMMGSIPLARDGYYVFQGKRFLLRPSRIDFTGKPTQPLLDINLVYRRYSRTVYITVLGLATEPSLNFSSDPFMTRDQILSFILFDTVDSGENAGDMLSMVGGGIAKSILGNIGLKVDTLLVTSQGFEVGKKITDKITVLYDQKSVNPRVIVRIKHSKRTETDISIGSQSQSVDIIYKREF